MEYIIHQISRQILRKANKQIHPFSTLTYICCDFYDIHQPDGKMIAEMSGQKKYVSQLLFIFKSPEHLSCHMPTWLLSDSSLLTRNRKQWDYLLLYTEKITTHKKTIECCGVNRKWCCNCTGKLWIFKNVDNHLTSTHPWCWLHKSCDRCMFFFLLLFFCVDFHWDFSFIHCRDFRRTHVAENVSPWIDRTHSNSESFTQSGL